MLACWVAIVAVAELYDLGQSLRAGGFFWPAGDFRQVEHILQAIGAAVLVCAACVGRRRFALAARLGAIGLALASARWVVEYVMAINLQLSVAHTRDTLERAIAEFSVAYVPRALSYGIIAVVLSWRLTKVRS